MEVLDRPRHVASEGEFGADELQSLMRRLHAWLPAFFSALRRVCDEPSNVSAQALEQIAQQLQAESDLVWGAPRRRPWIAVVDGARACVDQVVAMMRSYLAAAGARTPLEAQRSGAVAQSQMDAAGDVLDMPMTRWRFLTDLLAAETVRDRFAHLLQRAVQDFDAADLTVLDARAEAALASVAGTAAGSGCSVGLQYVLQRTAITAFGDPERFDQIVRTSAELMSRDSGLLAALAASPSFASDVEAAVLDLYDAASQAGVALSGQIPRQAGRALVDVAVSLVEGPGQIAVIGLCTGSGVKSREYERLRQDNATELLRSARQRPEMEGLLSGLNGDLRTAQAHRMLRYTDSGITWQTKSAAGSMSWAEVGEEIFLACESVMGCLIGLMHALSQFQFSVYRSDGYVDLGLSAQDMAVLALQLSGCTDVAVEASGRAWTIRLTTTEDQQLTVLAVILGYFIPFSVDLVALLADRDGRVDTLSGPTSLLTPFRELQDVDGDQYGLATLRFQCRWTLNGAACVNRLVARVWVARQGADALVEGVQGIPRLRALRDFARETDDQELGDSLTALIRLVRLGGSADQETRELVDRLRTWAISPVVNRPV
ncbi:hypothetical protein [Streptomyces sp. DSM 40484]|uniref:hypothetical protein n=1 Tax=Streptomyces kroppenstedtii TaxID=3051181 RepID=UPI0028D86611|nr:hypothetical protein [Streptomyces sp. DSM 40484]